MKAILTYQIMRDGEAVELTRLFNTAKAKKICDVQNTFGYKVKEIYLTQKGILFYHNINDDELVVADQKACKAWIGKNEPDKYIKYFGEVEEG